MVGVTWPGRRSGRAEVRAASASECTLHVRLLQGDAAALGEAYRLFGSVVFDAALRVTIDRHAAQHVTQETLLDLWRRPQLFHPERGGLRAWLTTVAHNRSIDWLRREQAARDRDRRVQGFVGVAPDVADDVETVLLAERVRSAVGALPDLERTAILLAYFGDRSYRQVAETLDVAEGTVKSRIRSGLRRLSRSMTAESASPR